MYNNSCFMFWNILFFLLLVKCIAFFSVPFPRRLPIAHHSRKGAIYIYIYVHFFCFFVLFLTKFPLSRLITYTIASILFTMNQVYVVFFFFFVYYVLTLRITKKKKLPINHQSQFSIILYVLLLEDSYSVLLMSAEKSRHFFSCCEQNLTAQVYLRAMARKIKRVQWKSLKESEREREREKQGERWRETNQAKNLEKQQMLFLECLFEHSMWKFFSLDA